MITPKDRIQITLKNLEFSFNYHLLLAKTPWLAKSANPFIPAFDDKSLIFIHVPKAAGSSVSSALFGGNTGHKPISRFYAYDPMKTRNYFSFTFVRNPWDRLWSAYRYFNAVVGKTAHRDHRWATKMLVDKPDFESFVLALNKKNYRSNIKKYDHFRDQAAWVCFDGNLKVDFVGRFESLSSDFSHICQSVGIDVPQLKKVRVSSNSDNYKQQYSPRMVAIVEDVYKKDIELFGYSFD